jgi:hypothetical protein
LLWALASAGASAVAAAAARSPVAATGAMSAVPCAIQPGVSRIAVDPVGADRDHLVIPALVEALHQLLDLGDGRRNGRGGHGGWRRLAHRLEKNQLQA